MNPEPFAPADPRLLVPPDELATAMLVWLRVMPKRIWREVEQYELKKAAKRAAAGDDPDLYRHVADYLAAKFAAASWEVVRPVPPMMVDKRPSPGAQTVAK